MNFGTSFAFIICRTAKLMYCWKTKNLTDMKRLDFIAPIIALVILASCSKTNHRKDSSVSARNSKYQKTQTFVAPPPQTKEPQENISASTDDSKSVTYDKSIAIDTSAHFEISKYAYYEVTDSNQRQVRPELIEKYRRARNNNTYINLYATDWDGIMKDRGLKPAKEKKTRVKKQRRQSNYYNNNYYGNNNSTNYRPRGLGIFPIFSYGWNSSTGWTPNIGVAVGPRSGWGPFGTATWGGRNRGMNYNIGMPMYYNNIYNQPFGYGGYTYGNNYYNNVYNYTVTSPTVVQSNGADNNQNNSISTPQNSTSSTNSNTQTQIKANGTDWSDGVGGPEKYTTKTKKISDYQIK